MATTEILSAAAGVGLEAAEDGSAAVVSPRWRLPLPAPRKGLLAALSALFSPAGAARRDLVDRVVGEDGHAALPGLLFLLDQMRRGLALRRTLSVGGEAWLTAEPIGAVSGAGAAFDPRARWALSRFAISRSLGERAVVESPLSASRVVVRHRRAAELLFELAAPRTCGELASRLALEEADARACLELLAELALVAPVTAEGSGETACSPRREWELHDLFFHSRSRRGRHDGGYGGTFRFGEGPEPLPAARTAEEDGGVALELPDVAALREGGPSFEAVLRDRRSWRRQGEEPLTLRQLGDLLHRSVGVVERVATEHGEWARRPYPAGGGRYELEVYPVVDRCRDLEPGLYHYRALDHRLTAVAGMTPEVGQLLEEARATAAMDARPQVLLVLAARFGRVAWKYESMAYALVLKHVGVVLQNLYLVATAMGLAPCALGGGDSDLFARASGLDYLEEGAVGELVLGSRPEGPAGGPEG